MRLALTADGRPEYDASGRVRVDLGDYEDWYHRDDLSPEAQAALRDVEAQNGGVAPLSLSPPATSPVVQPQGQSVAARELAAALTDNQKTNGRNLSPEELAARVRQEQARADKAEADARYAQLRAERERQALAAAERRRREAEAPPLDITLQPPSPPLPPDPVAAAIGRQRIAEAELAAYLARAEREVIETQLAAHREQESAGSPWVPAGAGCLAFFAVMGLMTVLVINHWAFGPLMLPCMVAAGWWAWRRTAQAQREAGVGERRAEYESRRSAMGARPDQE